MSQSCGIAVFLATPLAACEQQSLEKGSEETTDLYVQAFRFPPVLPGSWPPGETAGFPGCTLCLDNVPNQLAVLGHFRAMLEMCASPKIRLVERHF